MGFQFKLAKSRNSKLGDYRYRSQGNIHRITINKDLNPYSFLVTYIHEVAHMVAGQRYGYRIKPHGEQWQFVFKELMFPILKTTHFPEDVIRPLYAYMISPGASSCSDPILYKALVKYDAGKDNHCFLSDVALHQPFLFGKRIFMKEKEVRTRALCVEVKSKLKYYISLTAEVVVLEGELSN